MTTSTTTNKFNLHDVIRVEQVSGVTSANQYLALGWKVLGVYPSKTAKNIPTLTYHLGWAEAQGIPQYPQAYSSAPKAPTASETENTGTTTKAPWDD